MRWARITDLRTAATIYQPDLFSHSFATCLLPIQNIHTFIYAMVMDRSVLRVKTIQNNVMLLQSCVFAYDFAASAPLFVVHVHFNA